MSERDVKKEHRVLRYTVDEHSGCWLFDGYINKATGYGCIGILSAHRLSYESVNGPIPDGLEIDHKCRVRRCINPEHLEAVTRKENARRSPLIGRHPKPRKLTPEQRAEIVDSPLSTYKLAPVYGVSRETIRQARIEAQR